MGLLDIIKSALGLGSPSRDEEPDASTERAVKESPAAAGTDAGGSTASITETPPETPSDDDVAEAAESAEAAGPASQVEPPTESLDDDTAADSGEDASEADEAKTAETGPASATEEPPGSAATDEAEAAGSTSDGAASVETISGIGPAYASRLADAGVASVPDLLAADADALAEETGISAKRIGRWIDRAREE